MPAKGTRKKNPKGTQPRKHVAIPESLYDEIEQLAVAHNLVNPRNGKGNKSKLISLAILTLKENSKMKAQNKANIFMLGGSKAESLLRN